MVFINRANYWKFTSVFYKSQSHFILSNTCLFVCFYSYCKSKFEEMCEQISENKTEDRTSQRIKVISDITLWTKYAIML